MKLSPERGRVGVGWLVRSTSLEHQRGAYACSTRPCSCIYRQRGGVSGTVRGCMGLHPGSKMHDPALLYPYAPGVFALERIIHLAMGQLSPFVLCAAAGALALWLIALVRQAYRHDLKAIPGPGIAKFTGLYRLNIVMEGTAPQKYRKLHQTYGPAVRVGPNHVSFSDPAVIPTIYGIGSKFLKVRVCCALSMGYDMLILTRRTSTRLWYQCIKASPWTACSPPATQHIIAV